MNRNHADYDQNRQFNAESGFQTRRSEQYRHPEQHHTSYPQPHERFEDYDTAAQGEYGNRGNFGTYGYQGNEMAGSGNESQQDIYGTYSTSRNYGNMGSYGGAQGWGGYASQRRPHYNQGSSFDSGMSSPNWQQDFNRGNRGYQADMPYSRNRGYGQHDQGWEGNRDWHNDHDDRGGRWDSNRSSAEHNQFGSGTSGRFQDSRHGSYDLDRGDNPYFGSDRENEELSGYYMGSTYHHLSRGDYSSSDGNYGSLRRSDEERQYKPYGLSGYYSGGYGY